jgi:SNF2 family DNA or RNA helicase
MASASLLDNPDSSRVWGALHWLDPTILPPTVSLFERGFYDNFSPSYRYKQLKLKPTMEEELSRRLRTVSRRVLLKDTGAEVPERIIQDILVEMSPKLKKFYRQLRNDALAWHEDRAISRAEVLSRNMALLQVASGFIIDHPDPLEVMAAKMAGGDVPKHQILHIDTSHKDKALEAFCKELGPKDKVIIWAHHTHEINHLHALLPDLRGCPVARVDGSVTGNDRARAIRLFTEGRDFNTFLGQPGACGAGLNLQVAQYMVRWSRSHFITHHNQSLGRNLRAVRDQLFDKIVYACIMTDTTVDVRTELRNRGKREYAGRIMLDHLSYEERNL